MTGPVSVLGSRWGGGSGEAVQQLGFKMLALKDIHVGNVPQIEKCLGYFLYYGPTLSLIYMLNLPTASIPHCTL